MHFFSNSILRSYSSVNTRNQLSTPTVAQPGSPTLSSQGATGGAAALSPSSVQAQQGSNLRYRGRPTRLELSELNPLASPFRPRTPDHVMTRAQVHELAQLRFPRSAGSGYGSTSPTRTDRTATASPQERLDAVGRLASYRASDQAIHLQLSPRRSPTDQLPTLPSSSASVSSSSSPSRPTSPQNQMNQLIDANVHYGRRINADTISITSSSYEAIATGNRFTRAVKWLGRDAPKIVWKGAKTSAQAEWAAMKTGRYWWNKLKSTGKFVAAVITFVFIGRAYECLETGSNDVGIVWCTLYNPKTIEQWKVDQLNITLNGTFQTEQEKNDRFKSDTNRKFDGLIKVMVDLGLDMRAIKDALARQSLVSPDSDVHFGTFDRQGGIAVYNKDGVKIDVPVTFLPVIEPQQVADEANVPVEEFFVLFKLLSDCSYQSEDIMTATLYQDLPRYKGWMRLLASTQARVQRASEADNTVRTVDYKAWDELLYSCRLPFQIPQKYLDKPIADFFKDSRMVRYKEKANVYSPPRFRRAIDYQPFDDDDDILGQHEITDDIVEKVNRGEMAFMTQDEDEALRNMTADPYGWTEFTSTPYTNTTQMVEARPILPYQPGSLNSSDPIDVNQLLTIGLAIVPSILIFTLLLFLIKALNNLAASNRQNHQPRVENPRLDDSHNSAAVMLNQSS